MREETHQRNAGLSDAALSGVSGADRSGDCFSQATQFCNICASSGNHCGGKRLDSLLQYLKEHGKDSVSYYRYCPYYRP